MESRRINNSNALSFWYFWVKPKVRNTVNVETVWLGQGVGLQLTHDQRITPYRFWISHGDALQLPVLKTSELDFSLHSKEQ